MCNKCYREFNSQRWPTGRKRYGHQLMSWCVYNNIARKQKMLQVYQGLSDLFGLRMPSECLYRFKTYMANHYKKTYEEILAEILKSPVIHIDETTVNLKSDKGYVWVMTSINLVYYFYRESREGSFLKEMLSEFSGVLISDFYTAYDSIPCKHQKCLIHLIRDINDDLLKNPFDDELKKLGENFGKLLKNIVSTIDSFGLKKKELKIHKSEALHFLDDVCEKEYSSEIASNYQKRFNKNRNDLFRFLNYDNVAWNNNNVEHAINWFARYRRFAGGLFTKRSLEELLLLLSVIQTCEYNDINVLKFLLTGKKGVRSITRNYS